MGTPATGTSKKRPRCERADWAGKEKGGMEMQLERKVMVKPPKTFRGELKGFELYLERYRKPLRILSRRVM